MIKLLRTCYVTKILGNLFLDAIHIIFILVRCMEVVVQKGGVIELPNSVLVEFGIIEGKKLSIKVRDGEILIKPAKNITERLAGSIELDRIELIDEIVESEDWL